MQPSVPLAALVPGHIIERLQSHRKRESHQRNDSDEERVVHAHRRCAKGVPNESSCPRSPEQKRRLVEASRKSFVSNLNQAIQLHQASAAAKRHNLLSSRLKKRAEANERVHNVMQAIRNIERERSPHCRVRLTSQIADRPEVA